MKSIFKLENNAGKHQQRVGSVLVNHSNPSIVVNQEQDLICAKLISKLIQSNDNYIKSKTASITTSNKTDEIGLLKAYIAKYK
jgi:hypothetical protein